MNKEPKATFLMSTYNGREFLPSAVNSVIRQTNPNWKMIVVDDCSTDGSAELVAELEDPRIKVVRLDHNIGQTAALNIGLKLVDTTWTARLDQDDLALPERLTKQLNYLEENPETLLVGSWVDFIDQAGKVSGSFRPAPSPASVRAELYLRPAPIVHSAATFRTEIARKVGCYRSDLKYAEDLALWIELAKIGPIANVPEILVHLRRHTEQSSRAATASICQIEEALSVTEHLPLDLARNSKAKLAWQDRRLRLKMERTVLAAGMRDWQATRESSLEVARGLISSPLAIFRITLLLLKSAYRKLRYSRV